MKASVLRFALTCALLAASVLVRGTGFAAQTSVQDLGTRPGVTQRFLLIKPEKPVAAVILFAGGHGGLNISGDRGFGWGRGNFLVRSRELFARHELLVAVIDAPSDRLPSPALDFFRDTAAHAEDVRHVIAALRKEANAPVWLVGTSRGTTSVANAAIRLKDASPDGIVLTSSMVGNRAGWGSLNLMDVADIKVPTLVVHHENDGCRATLYQDAKAMFEKLAAAPKKEFVTFKGDGPPKGPPCEAHHYHGFIGIEDEVVARIADWIKANSKR